MTPENMKRLLEAFDSIAKSAAMAAASYQLSVQVDAARHAMLEAVVSQLQPLAAKVFAGSDPFAPEQANDDLAQEAAHEAQQRAQDMARAATTPPAVAEAAA